MTIKEFFESYSLLDDEYIDNGEIYCSKCKTPRVYINKENNFATHTVCECQSKEYTKNVELSKLENRYARLKELSLMGKKYENASFEKLDMERPESFVQAVNRCKKYCDNWEEVKTKGLGIYIFGDVGTGKTHLTCCIGNELMRKGVSVLFTSFIEISKRLLDAYGNRGERGRIIKELSEVDLLILDDIGTEKLIKNGEETSAQSDIYDILNRRDTNMLPTIFSSNFSINDLLVERGLMRRIVDRIAGMSTARIKLEGVSYRSVICNNNTNVF